MWLCERGRRASVRGEVWLCERGRRASVRGGGVGL